MRAVFSACVLALAASAAAAPCEIEYRITPRHDATPRVLEVDMSFPAGGRSETFLNLQSSWSGIDDFAASLGGWRGQEPLTRIEPTEEAHRFRVVHPPSGTVRVAFHARASLADPDSAQPQDVDESYRTQIGRDWFQFFGYSVLPSLDVALLKPDPVACLTIEPAGRPAVVVGGEPGAPAEGTAISIAGGRRPLWNAFYGGGAGWRVAERVMPTGVVRFAFRNDSTFAEADFADQAAAMIDAQRRFWREPAAGPAWWVITPNHTDDLNSGTVVRGASVLHVNRRFAPGSSAFRFLVNHESMHAWIPSRLGSIATDGSGASYWFAEGFAEFVSRRLLLLSGLWTPAQYAEAVTAILRRYLRSPLRNAGIATIGPRFESDRDASD